jgi:hypothetical protein
MANKKISELPLSFSGSPNSLMVIVNYDQEITGITNSIYFSALTAQFSIGDIEISGTTDGSNRNFTLSKNIQNPNKTLFYFNGQLQKYGDNYSITGTTLEILPNTFAPESTDFLRLLSF